MFANFEECMTALPIGLTSPTSSSITTPNSESCSKTTSNEVHIIESWHISISHKSQSIFLRTIIKPDALFHSTF